MILNTKYLQQNLKQMRSKKIGIKNFSKHKRIVSLLCRLALAHVEDYFIFMRNAELLVDIKRLAKPT